MSEADYNFAVTLHHHDADKMKISIGQLSGMDVMDIRVGRESISLTYIEMTRLHDLFEQFLRAKALFAKEFIEEQPND